MPCNSHCISPGYTVTISLILVLPLGAVAPVVAWSPTLKANDGIGICPLGSLVVVVIVVAVVVVIVVAVVVAVVVVIVIAVVVVCSRRPAPTVLGQVARLLAVSAWWCTRTIMVEVTLGTSRFSPLIWSPVTAPGSIGLLPFVWLLVLVISRSVFKLPLVFCLSLRQSVNPPIHQFSCHLNSLLHGFRLRCHNT
ncbi:hypothetical protein Tco_1280053 [Tanacetum coccineum]